uniref:Uncharacterized protein n=1 Tax=Solanum lycopersicum TaxID=4081 RepID=A0A3Q7GME3_SOLLC
MELQKVFHFYDLDSTPLVNSGRDFNILPHPLLSLHGEVMNNPLITTPCAHNFSKACLQVNPLQDRYLNDFMGLQNLIITNKPFLSS